MTLWYVAVPALLAIAVAAALLLRAGRPLPIPTVDAPALRTGRRRAAAIRRSLLLATAAALAGAYVAAPRPTGELSSLVGSGRDTVVVLDMSQSVSDLVYREISRTLEGIVAAAGDEGQLGLVLFSDEAQEALPPGAQASALEPYVRFFRPNLERGVASRPSYYRAAGPTEQLRTQYPLNPWFGRFSGGTRISTGLEAARLALAREGGGGRVILLSDLAEDDDDRARLARELVEYAERPELELRVVALPPATEAQKAIFARVALGASEVVDSRTLVTGGDRAGEPTGRTRWPFIGALVALGMALGAVELYGRPVRLPSAGRAGVR